MPKRNNVIPNAHFHKHWQERVKVWLDQPARKLRRRQARAKKARRVFPRPVQGLLRPAVRPPTIKYNMKVRFGRGFTFEELKAAGFNRHEARNIGVSVDHRRKNRSEEQFRANVQRLKTYKAKLVVFPRKTKKVKTGDTAVDQASKVAQLKGTVVPIKRVSVKSQARAITVAERKVSAYATLRKARSDARLVGIRKKRAEIKV
eukprot:TRINITY_DN1565_c0_g3_i3.p1 TRINITY_DN1565_c0_g3~~TRINITY_DN1565_c0_g3_i3.p1  ORF type:complete len:203 (-),score=54.00 TRINITY_DN1565_c0_g3_i3:160-768(-)